MQRAGDGERPAQVRKKGTATELDWRTCVEASVDSFAARRYGKGAYAKQRI
ncbi:hypothetical protein [Massilicoli timonensis]|uniref:hypothetical protein n=1 Tax=Massilicoli timonensis TaxID=2015901 RepID=UPI0015E1355C|nr:hypothetical protein [Massilicoli timonensis]